MKENGILFLDEDFMNIIFSNIHTDSNDNDASLQQLIDTMRYKFEEERIPAIEFDL